MFLLADFDLPCTKGPKEPETFKGVPLKLFIAQKNSH